MMEVMMFSRSIQYGQASNAFESFVLLVAKVKKGREGMTTQDERYCHFDVAGYCTFGWQQSE